MGSIWKSKTLEWHILGKKIKTKPKQKKAPWTIKARMNFGGQ